MSVPVLYTGVRVCLCMYTRFPVSLYDIEADEGLGSGQWGRLFLVFCPAGHSEMCALPFVVGVHVEHQRAAVSCDGSDCN